MGVWDALKKEILIDIIEWIEEDDTTIAYRYDRRGNDIRNGASLTVREGQTAVFVNEGQIADVFTPGMYDLTTENLPVLSRLKGWKYGFQSPFKAELYFISARILAGFHWGTPAPFMIRDPEFGILKLRARGHFSLHVVDAAKFIRNVVGTDGEFTKDEIKDRLRKKFITEAQSAIAEMGKPFYEMAAQLDDLSLSLKDRINLIFIERYGLSLDDTSVQTIELDETSQAKVEKRDELMFTDSRIGNYERQARADAMKILAGNPGPGGLAAGGMGMGMGLAAANQMAGGGMYGMNPAMGMMNPAMMGMAAGAGAAMGQAAAPPPPPPSASFHVVIGGAQQGPFPQAQVAQMIQQGQIAGDTMVWKQGMSGWAAASTVPELQGLFSQNPGSAAPPPPPVG